MGTITVQEVILNPTVNTESLLGFVKAHGDRHITQAAFDYYRKPENGILYLMLDSNKTILGMSASALMIDLGAKYGVRTDHSITVVHKELRNRGFGTDLLTRKLKWLQYHIGYVYKTIVAEDNKPSVRMCQKADLKIIDQVERTRRTGRYIAHLFADKREGL